MSRSATVKAFAKVNLGLRVLYQRPDGYHEIRTVFHTITVADRIQISFADSRATQVTVQGMPDVPDNLAARAAHAILAELRIRGTVRFAISKRIPMGAGLGGGSTDAAAVLLALPVLCGHVIPMYRLLALAAALGSDVPFFLLGGAAVGIGRGEELYPVTDYPPFSGVLLAPGIHVSTPDAYRTLSPALRAPERKLADFQSSVREPLATPLINDFESVVFARHPQLKRLKKQLADAGATHSLMSGSGSSLFGLFDRALLNRKETLQNVVQSFSGERALPFSLLTRSRYRSLWNKSLQPHTKGDLWPPRSLYAQ